ncbi:Uncharacterized protein PECH_008372 [Penicillium ucsense]|uniref:DNA 3'-5' helicase n=1 Tax=Penicillium ucsense TaxID=2839758 RepID=A0A8J8W9Z1_9EURO|nr:Uncharacterized protein PECM_002091 [Penicillium ucsense]KAF7734198.1 Uncharacterized protein PECH_008372 [Penicillium ucsense]
MDPILDGLNHAQREAVTSSAPILQVLAPPGSGKTKTLTARVAYLLSHHGYQPQDVICCTFTIKASREMRERLGKLIGEKLQSRLILGTFHSICRRYLVKYGYLIGLRKGFGIADSDDTRAILRRIIKRLKSTIDVRAAQGRISKHKAHGLSPRDLSDKVKADEVELVEIYSAYNEALAAANLLDYDDLLVRCCDLLRDHPECVSNVQTVLVDEFQDTNIIQYELMNLFAAKHRRITIVGDPDQSIYGFRSAEIQNLRRMQKKYSNTSVVLLESNYRSCGSILNSAQDVIEQDTTRPAKKLEATHKFGTLPVLRKLPNPNAEATWMVLEIKRSIALTGGLLRMCDFAVLLRSASLSTRIESAFGRAGIPYKMVGGRKFFDRVEVKTLLNYLRVVSHSDHSDALLSIINVPPRRIGDETIKQLTGGAEKAGVTLWVFIKDVIQGRRATEKKLQKAAELGLCSLVKLIDASRQKLQDCADASAPCVLLEYIVESLSFQEYLLKAYPLDEDGRWANVKELMGQASDVVTSDGETNPEEDLPEIDGVEQQQTHPGEEALSRFLANVALATEAQSKDEDDRGSGSVTISTIHAAKGLEWPVVFIPAVYNGSIPHSRAEVIDEERRLLYVAMTRAQALLYLSLPLKQPRVGEGEDGSTSLTPFLPPRIVKSRFRLKGPQFHEQVVYGIADTLRRARPAAEELCKDIAMLPSILDDRWTSEGEEIRAEVNGWDHQQNWGDSTQEPFTKRRRYDDERRALTSNSITSHKSGTSSTFMVPTTMSTGGFTSARDYIAVQPKDSKSGASSQAKAQVITTSAHQDGLNQASISTFFGNPGVSRTKDRSSQPSFPSAKSTLHDRLASSTKPQPQSDPSHVPVSLASHRLQPRPLHPSRPALEPAGPTNYTWMAAPTSSHAVKPARMFSSPAFQNQLSESTSKGPVTSASSSSVRSKAFYTTTMDQVRQQAPTTTGRRTLGIRRSMNGWADRMKREKTGGQGDQMQ